LLVRHRHNVTASLAKGFATNIAPIQCINFDR
jgi:hypothetical protein